MELFITFFSMDMWHHMLPALLNVCVIAVNFASMGNDTNQSDMAILVFKPSLS